jgi:hypothetical protein
MGLPFVSARSSRGGLFAASTGGGGGGGGGAEVTRQSDLTAWWKCEDETEEIGDPGGYDFTLNNGAAVVSGGSHGASTNAIDCDGTNDYVLSGAFDLDSATAISISMWLKSDGAYTTSGNPVYDPNGYYGFVNLTTSTALLANTVVGFGQYTGSTIMMWYRLDGGARTNTTTTSYHDAGWDAQDWTLWTMTWASGSKFQLYRNADATPVATSAATVSGAFWDTTDLQCMLSKPPQYAWYTECRWDDIRVYGLQLSTSEISDIYNGGDGDW